MKTWVKSWPKHRFIYWITVILLMICLVACASEEPEMSIGPFIDIPQSHEFYPYIQDLLDKGIIRLEEEEKRFRPDDNLSWEEAERMLGRALGPGSPESFKALVKEAGEDISREAMARIMVLAFDFALASEPLPFSDLAGLDQESREAIQILSSHGVIRDFEAKGVFGPGEPISRGYFVRMLSLAMDKEPLRILEIG